MHTVWKGSISFGLVNIPIKLFTAVAEKNISFRLLHKTCNTPIKQQRVCPQCNVDLIPEEIVKGFPADDGGFVIVSDEELSSLKETGSRHIEILDFVNLSEIDPIYFNRSYFVGPEESGGKAYSLLHQALLSSSKIGVATINMRSKKHLVVLRPYNDALVMETIFYPDEIKNVDELPVPAQNFSDQELKTAVMLIDQLTAKFDPNKYKSEYRAAFEELLKNKEERVMPATAPTPNNVLDLMSALQASIERNKAAQRSRANEG